jgi:hypothetical protein
MIKIEDGVPPPVRHNLSDVIRELEVDQSAYFPLEVATVDTVRATVTRIKGLFEGRDYITAKADQGVRVWRTA